MPNVKIARLLFLAGLIVALASVVALFVGCQDGYYYGPYGPVTVLWGAVLLPAGLISMLIGGLQIAQIIEIKNGSWDYY